MHQAQSKHCKLKVLKVFAPGIEPRTFRYPSTRFNRLVTPGLAFENIYISSDSKKLKGRYGLAFEKFRDIRDTNRVPNRMSGGYTIRLYNDEPSI